MRWLPIFILVLFFSEAWASFNQPLTLKQVSSDGNQFVFVRRQGQDPPWNGITIKDPHTKVMLYEARVTKCSKITCLGTVVRNHSGIKLRIDEEYVHSYNETPIKWDPKDSPLPVPEEPKPVPPPKVEEKKPEPPKPSPKPKPVPKVVPEEPKATKKLEDMDRAASFSFGSPVGPGFKLGYHLRKSYGWLGFNYASISSTTNMVSIKGHLASASLAYNLVQFVSILDINAVAELGVMKADLDFTGVDAGGPTQSESTYFAGVGGEAKLNLDRWALAVKSGMSKTGLAASYSSSGGDYNNPYGSILVFLEIGAFYRF